MIADPRATVWLALRDDQIAAVGQTTAEGHAEGAGKITPGTLSPLTNPCHSTSSVTPNSAGMNSLTQRFRAMSGRDSRPFSAQAPIQKAIANRTELMS